METEGIEGKMIMLTGTLQNIVDNMNEKLNIFKKEYSEAVKEIQELKNETEKIKYHVKELRSLELESRNRNIVIFGLKGDVNESKLDTYNRVMDLFSEVLQVNFKEHQIDNLYWIGKRKQNRPLLIKFTNSLTKEYIMGRKGMFRGCKIRLENDYSPEICAVRRKLVEYMWVERRRGKHAVLVGDKIRVNGVNFDLEYYEKNFKTGVGSSKRKESGREAVSQGEFVELMEVMKKMNENMDKRFQQTNSYLEGNREIEKKVGGEIKGKSKELSQETAIGVGQQTRSKNFKRDEKQEVNKGEISVRKDRRGERRNTSSMDGNWTLKKWVLTKGHEQRTDKNEVLSHQGVRNDESTGMQHVTERMQRQQGVEWSGEKGNDLQRLPREFNQVYRDRSIYNLRIRPENKT